MRAATFLAAATVIALAAGAAWWFLGGEKPPERPVLQPAYEQTSDEHAVPPPFYVKGTVMAREGRSAMIAIKEADGTLRPEQKVREGDTIEGYRLTDIQMHRVYFEKSGIRYLLFVGGERMSPLPPDTPVPTQRPRRSDMKIVPPPADFDPEAARRQVQRLIDQMRQSPRIQERLQQRRRELYGPPDSGTPPTGTETPP